MAAFPATGKFYWWSRAERIALVTDLNAAVTAIARDLPVSAGHMSDREVSEGGWGLNIGAFERRYSAWRIESPDGIHLTAQRKVNGRPRGYKVKGRNLDELARKIDEAPS